jgi:hypothetical protein
LLHLLTNLKLEAWEQRDGEEYQADFQAAASLGERRLMGTQEYDSTYLVRLMYTAILCGAAANPYAGTKIKNLHLEQGRFYKLEALKMTPKEYTWGTLQARVGSQISNETDSYYVVGIIGADDTSKVFHALDATGKECVIKMYTKRTDDDRKTLVPKQNFVINAEAAAKREVCHFELLYPGIGVMAKTIYDHHCVVLPLFRPIQKAKRKDHMAAIKQELQRFARKGLKYATCDVCWRHVGLHDGNIVLFDHADLESLGNESVEEVAVQQEKELRSRME